MLVPAGDCKDLQKLLRIGAITVKLSADRSRSPSGTFDGFHHTNEFRGVRFRDHIANNDQYRAIPRIGLEQDRRCRPVHCGTTIEPRTTLMMTGLLSSLVPRRRAFGRPPLTRSRTISRSEFDEHSRDVAPRDPRAGYSLTPWLRACIPHLHEENANKSEKESARRLVGSLA